MTVILSFEEENGQTRYTARVRHWSKEDYEYPRARWGSIRVGPMRDQLAALAKTI